MPRAKLRWSRSAWLRPCSWRWQGFWRSGGNDSCTAAPSQQSGTWDCGYAAPPRGCSTPLPRSPRRSRISFAWSARGKRSTLRKATSRSRRIANRDTRSVFRKRVPAALHAGWPVRLAVSLASAGADPALRSVHRPDALSSVDLEVELMATIAAIAHILAALALAPLFGRDYSPHQSTLCRPPRSAACAIVLRPLQAPAQGGRLQPHDTWIFVAGPVVGLAAPLVALAIVPLGGVPGLLAFPGDLVLLAYLLGLMRFRDRAGRARYRFRL